MRLARAYRQGVGVMKPVRMRMRGLVIILGCSGCPDGRKEATDLSV